MGIGIFGKALNDSYYSFLNELITALKDADFIALFYAPFAEEIKNIIDISSYQTFNGPVDTPEKLDYIISLGGDGNMLNTVAMVHDSGIPILGINMGRLGFLSSVNREQIKEAITALKNSNFKIDSRRLLKLSSHANLFSNKNFALNEVTVYKQQPNSMVSVHVYIDDEYLNSYWADGLIIATPTGSTAYSLSTGGPIISPEVHNFIITPIAPHNLSVRPLVIPDDKKVRLKVSGRDDSYFVSLDARTQSFQSDEELIIEKENFEIHLIRLLDENFFSTIRAKLLWGIDKRN
ncbi:MAG: NAD kinase [Bacteroidales bacterium]|jgi:NAD+ kinase|nr:NAD kinase [Bacteroidales bacterium]